MAFFIYIFILILVYIYPFVPARDGIYLLRNLNGIILIIKTIIVTSDAPIILKTPLFKKISLKGSFRNKKTVKCIIYT